MGGDANPSRKPLTVPLDFSALSKDSWLTAEALERHLGISRSHPHYHLRLREVQQQIEDQCGILTRQEDVRLRLMTDVEASRWNTRNAIAGVRRVFRAEDRTQYIDRTSMTSAQAAEADHQARYVTGLAEGVRRARKRLGGNPAADLPPADDDGSDF